MDKSQPVLCRSPGLGSGPKGDTDCIFLGLWDSLFAPGVNLGLHLLCTSTGQGLQPTLINLIPHLWVSPSLECTPPLSACLVLRRCHTPPGLLLEGRPSAQLPFQAVPPPLIGLCDCRGSEGDCARPASPHSHPVRSRWVCLASAGQAGLLQ